MSSIWPRLQRYAVPALLVIAVGLRLYHLGWRDFWYDEAFTGVLVQSSWRTMMHMAMNDVHPPLYYLGLKAWCLMLGTSVVAIRLYSVLFGVATIWGVYRLTQVLAGRRAGLLAATVMTVAPFAIQYSQEARMYTQLSFLLVMATYLYWQWWQRHRVRDVLGWGVVMGLAALTHYFGLLYLALFGLHAIGAYIMYGWRRREMWRRALPTILWLGVGAVVALAVFTPWIPYFLEQYHRTRYGLGWIPAAQPLDIVRAIHVFIVGSVPGNIALGVAPANTVPGVSAMTAAIVTTTLVGIMSLWLAIRAWRQVGVALWLGYGIVALTYALSLSGRQYFVPRFLSTAAIFFFVAIGIWLSRLRRWFGVGALALIVVGLSFVQRPTTAPAWNDVPLSLTASTQPTWYVLNALDYVTGKYYLGDQHLVLFTADNPSDNPESWAAIGPTLRRVTSLRDIAADQQAVIITTLALDRPDGRPASMAGASFVRQATYGDLGVYRLLSIPAEDKSVVH